MDVLNLPEGGEILAPDRVTVKQGYAACIRAVDSLQGTEMLRRQAFADRASDDLGAHMDRVQDPAHPRGLFRMDLFPRIIESDEWEFLQRAVLQRARAFSAFVKDIHGEQRILREGILRSEVVFEDPAWFPELSCMDPCEIDPVMVGAVDLMKTASGEWKVIENRFSTPTGLAYLIQIRRIMAQAMPEMFGKLPVFPVATFATRIGELLASANQSSNRQRASVVMLSAGQFGRHFLEDAFLARQMGIPLVQAADLVVRDHKVFLRTLSGLFRVNVIYRRIENSLLDPVAFSGGAETGVPGLVHAVRKGNVRIVNGLGSGIADNRALLPYSNDIVRFYLGENAWMQTVPTYHGFDPDQAELIRSAGDEFVFKPICHPDNLGRSSQEIQRLLKRGRLRELFSIEQRLVVAQQIQNTATMPVFDAGKWTNRTTSLRLFFTLGNRPLVLPGGLTRLLDRRTDPMARGEHAHFLKDTWVLEGKRERVARRKGRLESQLTPEQQPLTSRAAESWYWMGRYLERARSTARKRRVLETLKWDELSPQERGLYLPLLKAVAAQTEIPLERGGRRRGAAKSFGDSLMFGNAHPSSVQSCIQGVARNASAVRDLLTPEFNWVIQDTLRVITEASQREPKGTADPELLAQIVRQSDLVLGVGERTLLHDAGWHLFRAAMQLECAESNVVLLESIMPHLIRRQWEHLRDDTDLTALLRILGALDAYHRKFRSRAYLDRVMQLVWKDPECPASIRFCTAEAFHHLSLTLGATQSTAGDEIMRICSEFIATLDEMQIGDMLPARAMELDHGLTRSNLRPEHSEELAMGHLTRMREFFASFHQRLEDDCFNHHPQSGRAH